MNSGINQFWLQCMSARIEGLPLQLAIPNSEALHPVGECYDPKYGWTFEILLLKNVCDEDLGNILPSTVSELILNINEAFKEYILNVGDDSWKCNIKKYLVDSYDWPNCCIPKLKNIVNCFETGNIHKFLKISRITLLEINDVKAVVFDFQCPVEEYFNEYGFCFIKKEGVVEYVTREVCWDLRISNGGNID